MQANMSLPGPQPIGSAQIEFYQSTRDALLERALACPRAALQTGWTSVDDAGAGPLRDTYLAAQAGILWRQE